MFALRGLPSREPSWRLLSLSGGAPVQWSATVLESADDGNLVKLRTSLGEIITLVDGRIARIEVEATELEIVAQPDASWPSWTVEGPRTLTWTKPADADFEVRPLELPGKPGEPRLLGELLLPPPRDAPLPAVLMLSATGQEDRYGFAGPPPVDLGSHELGDALAQAGFAVLRFDDRGRGESEPGPRGFLAQVDDARRALGTLLVQPEIDPDRVVVLGHGEGGLRALVLASERAADVHAVALLATPGRPYEQVLRAQAAARVEQLPPDVREQVRQQQRTMIDDLVSGRAVPEELAPQAQWLREVFAVDPAGLVARLRVPVLVAQGGKDFEIDPVADAGALERAGKRRGKLSVRRYPGLDHLFKPEPGLSSPERYLVERRVDTTFITDVIAWVDRVTRTTGRGRKPQAAGSHARSSDGASK
jgi:pimeloyl-ACP methyl ester carboxylesterase